MTGRVVPLVAGRRAAARAAAQGRHPSARSWAPDRRLVVDRLATRARAGGAAWPRVAAAALLLRGIAGDDQAEFAARLGVAVAELAALEQGRTSPAQVPPALRQVVHLVDWAWVDADPGGATGAAAPA